MMHGLPTVATRRSDSEEQEPDAEVVVVDPVDPPRTHRGRLVAAAVAVTLVAAGVAVGYRQWDGRVAADLTEASVALDTATSTLAQAITAGDEVLVSSQGRVGDEQARTELADVLVAARGFDTARPTDGSRQARTRQAAETARDADEHTESVRTATTAVTAAVTAWELEQAVGAYEAARTGLDEAITAGEQTLVDSDGHVLDNAAREQLRAALDGAIVTRDTAVDESDIDALTAAAEQIAAAQADVSGSSQAVGDARAAWQAAEDERIAIEQAAAARAKSSGSGNRSSGSGTGSAAGSGTASPDEVWTDTRWFGQLPGNWVESGSDTWCGHGDSSGNAASGGWC